MKSDLENVATFIRVVQEGSFTAASATLNCTPSAVSKKVARLENQLGVSLLSRTTRKLMLTGAGQEFFDRCASGLSQISQAEEAVLQFRNAPQGVLRVNAPQGFGRLHIAPLIPKFMSLYPGVEIDLDFGHSERSRVDKHIDVIIASADPANINLASRVLMPIERVTCASPTYLRQHGKPKDYKDLARHNCLMFTDSTSVADEWAYHTKDGIKRVRVSGNFRTNNTDAMYWAVTQGLGIAHMPTFVVGAAVASGQLETIFRDGSHKERHGAMIKAYYPPAKHRLPKVKVFVDFLVKSLQQDHQLKYRALTQGVVLTERTNGTDT